MVNTYRHLIIPDMKTMAGICAMVRDERDAEKRMVPVANLGAQLRAAHAQCVWQEMQAVLAVAACWEQATALCEGPSGPSGSLAKCEAMQVACGWLPRSVLP